jgi:hypothetical protein
MRSWRKEWENRGNDFLIPQEKYGALDIEDDHRLFFRFLFFKLFVFIYFNFLDFWPFCNATMRLLYIEKRSLKYRLCGSLQTCYSLCSTDNHPSKVHPYPPSGDSLSSSMDRALRTRASRELLGTRAKGNLAPLLQFSK